jgi:hypothetical protein
MTDKLPDDAELVWEEYKYRHEHIWSTVYKLTYTVSFLGALPYLNKELACDLGHLILAPCALGITLSIVGFIMIYRELQVFGNVKDRHREIHKPECRRGEIEGKSRFKTMALLYLIVLSTVSVFNVWVVNKWLCLNCPILVIAV